ncbi:MAG: Helix-turn-helix domain [Planctomycetota bacterium]|nr:Helix-turn-helix domain [Planctomycetota bacterium]
MKKKEDFGMLVKKFREKNKLTVFQLARASGLSRDTIYKIERGDRSVSLITLYKVAAALDIPASFLV